MLGATSEYIEASSAAEGAKAQQASIAVELDLRLHASGGVSAEAAFHRLEKECFLRGMKPWGTRGLVTPSYQDTVTQWIDSSFDAGSFDRPNTGTHRAILKLNFPAVAISNDTEEGALSSTGRNPIMFVRSAAALPNVGIGAIVISPKVSTLQSGERRDWDIAPKVINAQPTYLSRTQVANFLFKLESQTDSAHISKVTLGKIAGKEVSDFSVRLSMYAK